MQESPNAMPGINPAIFAMELTLNIRFLIALLAVRPVHLHSMQSGSLVLL